MKFWYNPTFLAIFGLLALSIPALKNLPVSTFYTNHDGETHVARLAQYYQATLDGQIPPRFAASFYNGLGSPIFVYIYPVPYILGSLIHSLGINYVDSFKIEIIFGYIGSSLFSYLWLREVTKSEKAAFLGALFYTWVPYRFLLIYVRGSISELLAYTFLPLVLYTLTKLKEKLNPKWTAATAISIALLLLSQNLVAMISLPIVAGYVLILSLFTKPSRYLLQSTVAAIWGLAIAAFTYLPSIFERNYVRFDEVFREAYVNHFVTLKQLIRSPWGYGFDLPGTINDELSFQIGLAQISVFLISILLILYYFFKKVINFNSQFILSVFFILVFIISVFLMIQSQPTIFVWQHVKPLGFVDLPWRFLGLTALATAFLATYLVRSTKSGLFFIFLIIFVLVANRNHLRINQKRQSDDNFFKNYNGTATQYNEFTPKWRQTTREPIGFDPSSKVNLTEGEATVYNVLVKSNQVAFETDVESSQAQVRINKFYFPGWGISVDNRQLIPFKDFTVTGPNALLLEKEQDSSGLMGINLEKGHHKIVAKFGETNLRLFADYLTLGSSILALGVIAKNVKT